MGTSRQQYFETRVDVYPSRSNIESAAEIYFDRLYRRGIALIAAQRAAQPFDAS